MSFFYDNALTTVTIPSQYSTTGAYAVNGDTRLNIGVIRAYNNPDLAGTGTFNYFMCMSKDAPVGPSTNNYKGIFKITQNGSVYTRDTYYSSYADYAEYFELFDGQPLPYGTTVVVVHPDEYELTVVMDDGTPADDTTKAYITNIHQTYSGALDQQFIKHGYVRAATSEDDPTTIIGVTRPSHGMKQPSVVGNAAWSEWQNMYVVDEFGLPMTEPYYHMVWNHGGVTYDYPADAIPSHITMPSSATKSYFKRDGTPYTRAVLNPTFKIGSNYTPRQSRPEWSLIGLLGQVPVRNDVPHHPGWTLMSRISDRVNQMLIK